MHRLICILAVICAMICACNSNDDGATAQPAPWRYDLEGLPRCSRLSALAAWQGSCDDGEACAWAPELDDGVCAPGCDTSADCPEGSACRHTDDGGGWARRWCAPHIPGPM